MLERLDQAIARSGHERAGRSKVVADPGDLSYLLRVVSRRRRTIIAAALIGLGLAVAYLALATPQYRASARILVDFRRLTAIGQDQFAINGKVNDSAVDSQKVIIDSPGIAQQVVRTLKLDQDPEFIEEPWPARVAAALWPFGAEPETEKKRFDRAVEVFGDRLRASRIGVSYVIAVDFLSRDAAKATRIANEVAAVYIRDQLSAKLDAAGTANDWFQNRVKALNAQANDAEKAVVDYRTKNQIMLVDGKFVDEQQVGEVSTQLITARSDRASAQARLDQIEILLKNGGVGAVADELRNVLIVTLRQKRGDITRRIAETIERFGSNHESLQRLRNDIREIDGAIAAEFKRIADGYRSDAAVARLREDALQAKLEEVVNLSARSQQARIELAQLQSVAQTLKGMRDTFAGRYVEASQEQSFPITEARVISEATQPDEAAVPNTKRVLGAGLAIGSALGCVLALLSETLSRRTRTREQIEGMIAAPCVAVVAKLRPDELRRGILELACRSPTSPFAEAMRSIRVAVDERRASLPHDGGAVIAFAAPAAGDGTTTIATNFAGVVARPDAPVLLVDLDLRQRGLSRGFAAGGDAPDTDRAGIRELLAGRATFRQVVQVRDSGVHVITAGNPRDGVGDPTRWLQSAMLSTLLRTARQNYRCIVLDLPPVIPVGDARTVAGLIDMFFLVVTWNVTTMEEIAEATSLNGALSSKLVGAVLNKADAAAMAQLDDLSLSRSVSYLGAGGTSR
jgi:succinoglycan biosynthesis transport protein ExoP